MRHQSILGLTALFCVTWAKTSPKRGLVYIPDRRWPDDYKSWTQPGAGLTWYYNYQSSPSAVFAGLAQQLEFVPMLWGAIDDTSFLDSVLAQLDGGANIRHVLGFNEPDGSAQYGGSSISPQEAAQVWIRNMEPLADRGLKLGLPSCVGGHDGLVWLQSFLHTCADMISESSGGDRKECTYHFVPIHSYGDFQTLASHMGSYSAAFPNLTQWVTEYNFANQDLSTSQAFFNQSTDYLDRMDGVARYSFFASFRSGASNVGSNAVMLSDDGGKLTDMGAWYLGLNATGVSPTQASTGSDKADPPAALALVIAIFGAAALIG